MNKISVKDITKSIKMNDIIDIEEFRQFLKEIEDIDITKLKFPELVRFYIYPEEYSLDLPESKIYFTSISAKELEPIVKLMTKSFRDTNRIIDTLKRAKILIKEVEEPDVISL